MISLGDVTEVTAVQVDLLQWLMDWAKVTTGWELWLVVFGVFAQAIFFGRWLVQWIASERKGESHMPDMFWWLSLAGASMLFVYFLLRGEPVGLLGQSVGWIVYSRNLYLIKKQRRLSSSKIQCLKCGYKKGPESGDKCPECGNEW